MKITITKNVIQLEMEVLQIIGGVRARQHYSMCGATDNWANRSRAQPTM